VAALLRIHLAAEGAATTEVVEAATPVVEAATAAVEATGKGSDSRQNAPADEKPAVGRGGFMRPAPILSERVFFLGAVLSLSYRRSAWLQLCRRHCVKCTYDGYSGVFPNPTKGFHYFQRFA
jgi:hypothetical protein